MAGFIYYVPGAQNEIAARTAFASTGAAHVLAGTPGFAPAGDGPRGAGQLVAHEVAGAYPEMAYVPGRQTWTEAPGGAWWVGFPTAAPPGPADLAVEHPVPGAWVELGDARRWMIPVARRYVRAGDGVAATVALPRANALGADGHWHPTGIMPRYRALWDRLERQLEVLGRVSGDGTPVTQDEYDAECALVVAAIATNYRVGPVECTALGLVADDAIAPVIRVLADWDGLDLLKKKLEPAGDSTSPGGGA
jgi:hypothetical protein